MSNTDQCRDIEELNPLCQILLNKALRDIKASGINPLIVETYRSQVRQNYLYSLGRTVKGNKVTWTQVSIHTKRNAIDLVPQRKIDGKMTAIWNALDKETKKIIAIMIGYGFEAGANWSTSPDSPHFQIKGVSATSKSFGSTNTNVYITKMIQNALNDKIKVGLKVDGKWGSNTTKAVNKFRSQFKWKEDGKVGVETLKKLL
ncbi:M15 family metallopeptidase [Anaerosporobacter sp.]|uniref:M15 family metallopeptidase n=1 Tax=Anaerosporobacter sp. TaxID=1872529 RepID=UPI00289AF33E|nr:M15 family metallopeptidase [Anaerosporobacter sp.]